MSIGVLIKLSNFQYCNLYVTKTAVMLQMPKTCNSMTGTSSHCHTSALAFFHVSPLYSVILESTCDVEVHYLWTSILMILIRFQYHVEIMQDGMVVGTWEYVQMCKDCNTEWKREGDGERKEVIVHIFQETRMTYKTKWENTTSNVFMSPTFPHKL